MSTERKQPSPERRSTQEGLPLDVSIASTTTADINVDGPTRRVSTAPSLASSSRAFSLAQPSFATVKTPADNEQSSAALAPPSLPKKAALNVELTPPSLRAPSREHLRKDTLLRRSLIDDEDDDLTDPFSTVKSPAFASASIDLMESEDEQVTNSRRWLVRDENVPTLPSFYPLDKSAIFIPQASAPDIASRIQKVLRQRSIVTSFCSKNAKAECTSKTLVDFHIRLYRGRGEYKHGIIVEVQRREGFDLSYQKDVFAILDAAEGKEPDANLDDTPIFFEEESADVEASFTSLRLIADVLCKKNGEAVKLDGVDFALTALGSLTNVDRMGESAIKISKQLVSSPECAELRGAVFANIEDSSRVSQRQLLKSLEVLANISVSTRGSQELMDFVFANDSIILDKLISHIECVAKEPRAADLACVTVKSICDSAMAREQVDKMYGERLRAALIGAVEYGNECFADLELHSNHCLHLIGF